MKRQKEAQDLVWPHIPGPADAQCESLGLKKVQSERPSPNTPPPAHTSDHRADAAVFGLGAAGSLRGRRRRAVVVGPVGGVRRMTPVAVGRVGRLLAVRRRRVVLVRRVLQVGRRVVVVVVVVRRGVLGHGAELAVVGGGRRVSLRPGRVVQVGGVRGVRDEGGVQRLWGGAGGLHPPGAEQRSEQRGGVGQRLAAVAGRAVSGRGGPPAHVGAANDGPLQERGRSDLSRETGQI